MRILLLFIGSFWVLTGCLTTGSLTPDVEVKPVHVKAASYDKVWNVAVAAVARRFPNVESDKAVGVIKGRDGVEYMPWLEAVGIFIRPTENSDQGYFLDVVSERRLWKDDGPDQWRKKILQEIQKKLGSS
jgi:hypothetical protein